MTGSEESKRRSIGYALLFAVPPGVATGSGIYLNSGLKLTGVLFGLFVGSALFMLLYVGREYGSTNRTAIDVADTE